MARLYRPHIPLSVRVKVAERQAAAKPNEGWRFYVATGWNPKMHFGKRLKVLLEVLAQQFRCTVANLRLDHDPALGARPKHRRGLGKKTYYVPDANDPDHLFYRPHGPEFDGSHLIKTNVRGDHGQHPDRVLIKKQRRIERGPKPRRAPKMQGRGFSNKSAKKTSRLALTKPKWAKRPFPNRSKRR